MGTRLEVVRAGALATVQDLGRPGLAHLAVPRSGALDEPALRLANRLVGNDEGAAAIETTLDGVAVRASQRCHVAVTGADSQLHIGGRAADWGVAQLVPAGEIVEVGRARRGLRSYLAVGGGIAVAPVLGSRSTDLLAGLGPPVLATGMVLPLGPATGEPARMDFAPYRPPQPELMLECRLGPREDWLSASALDTLAATEWTVSPQSNRIALRLAGPVLRRRQPDEFPSEGMVLGSVQVPADGQPVVFLADHPTTGGYPVVGVVPEPDIWRCGQAVPGSTIRLRLARAAIEGRGKPASGPGPH